MLIAFYPASEELLAGIQAHVLGRLVHQIGNSADPVMTSLLDELKSYPVPPGSKPYRAGGQTAFGGIAVPLELTIEGGCLSFLSTTTVFGTALDISLSEIAIESFFPTDSFPAEAMRRLGGG